ncbi:hypothetical protein, partial [Mammaliicoccus sp. K-M42]|uniref:hypothetical protein n=1 Tax=Mammaliicoccus sp. K-M42 TaxID=2898701 RepID=UPI001EFC1618
RSLLIKRPPTFLILTILLFKEVVQLSVDGPLSTCVNIGALYLFLIDYKSLSLKYKNRLIQELSSRIRRFTL